MKRALPALLLLTSGLGGCSLVYDPNDHLAPVDPCDRDRDGFLAADSICYGTDCDDSDATRYPGAAPRCDGQPPRDCRTPAIQPALQAAFGVSGSTGVDFGYLPLHVDNSMPGPSVPATAPPLEVHIAGFESQYGQASIAFVAGAGGTTLAPHVFVYDYAVLTPDLGVIHDPGLGVPSAFDLGGIDATTARVLATERGFTGVGSFLSYRDVTAGLDRPILLGTSADALNGNSLGTAVRDTVALAGEYLPTQNGALDPQMVWVERSLGDSADRLARLPWDDVSAGAFRYAALSAGATDGTRLWASGGASLFSTTQGVANARVWNRLADSGASNQPSGALFDYTGVNLPGTALIEPAVVPVGSVGGTTATYALVYVDSQGVAHVQSVSCTETGGGVLATSVCQSAGDTVIDATGVEVTAVAAAPTPGNGAVLALSALVNGTLDRGVLLYYAAVTSTAAPTVTPFAHWDDYGRPWVISPSSGYGRYFERLDLATLDMPLGATARWTVLLAGVSDYRTTSGAAVAMGGVVGCIP